MTNDPVARKSSLHDLPRQIERAHQDAREAAQSAIANAIRCGELLLEAKRQVGHGGWLSWVAANLSFGERQAAKYTRLAAFFGPQGANQNLNSDLEAAPTIDAALRLLRKERESPRPAPKGTADLSAKRHLAQRRQDEIARLAARMTEVGSRYGGAAVAEAQNRYTPTIESTLMDMAPWAPSKPPAPAPAAVVELPRATISALDRVVALIEQAIGIADASEDVPPSVRAQLATILSTIVGGERPKAG